VKNADSSWLHLRKTKVTDAGVNELQQALLNAARPQPNRGQTSTANLRRQRMNPETIRCLLKFAVEFR